MSLHTHLANLLTTYQTDIDQLIHGYIEGLERGRLNDAFAYALLNGGKRLRPAVVQMVAKALGQPASANQAALAVEFFHTASLIADDLPCMDNDDMRRNKPSLHRAYDEATALLVSYGLIAAGYDCVARNSRNLNGKGNSVALMAIENVAYNTGLRGATGGQWLDLMPPDLSEKTLRMVVHRKTVSLFEMAFVFGWLFGGGDTEKLDQVKRAAEHFGVAFQIADDLSDQTQDENHRHRMNFATVLGSNLARAAFQKEIDSYRSAITSLAINSQELMKLSDILNLNFHGL